MYTVTMARKPPSEPSVVGNVLRHGAGGLYVDASRVPADEADRFGDGVRMSSSGGRALGKHGEHYERGSGFVRGATTGRWPSNLLLGPTEALDEQCEGASRYFWRLQVSGM